MSSSGSILIVGSGGREHALAWRLGRDVGDARIRVAPGNDGMARRFRCIPIPESETDALIAACRSEHVDLVVVGPEAPLASGLTDRLAQADIAVFGPSAQAARLESSKWFAKQMMREAGVPTARALLFDERRAAVAALDEFEPPWVIKANGLAGGKGVLVTEDRAEAETFLTACLEQGRFGASGRQVLLEAFLEGEETSLMAVCDGKDLVVLPPARDYKRANDGDHGPNTGGMGAYAPSAAADLGLEAEVTSSVFRPIIDRMAACGTPFRGVLYAGLIVGGNGLQVAEFNVRFGDPETQVVLPLIDGSFEVLLAGAAAGRLDPSSVRRGPGGAVAVALVDQEYPEKGGEGGVIEGLEALMDRDDLLVFHAASRWEAGQWRVQGGRAAYVAAHAETLAEARDRVYAALETLRGRGWRYRRDIAGGLMDRHARHPAGEAVSTWEDEGGPTPEAGRGA